MTHEDLVQRLAGQLGWSDMAVSDALDAIIAVLKTELAANNPVDLDDFGKFSTPKQPEYILTDRETNDRYLMPPAVEVLFESSADLFFMPEDSLNESVNSAFSFFEPTPLYEGVALPGVPEVIVGGDEEDEEEVEKTTEETDEAEKGAEVVAEEIGKEATESEKETAITAEESKEETTEVEKVTEKTGEAEKDIIEAGKNIIEAGKKTEKITGEIVTEMKIVRNHRPYPPLWIPIAGGVALALAALFFFRVWQPRKNESAVAFQQLPEAGVLSVSRPDILRSEATENHDVSSGTLPDTTGANTLHRELKNKQPLPEVKKIRLADGKTLRLLAQDLFGDREFWVYIYLENKSQINNPNRVPAGTELTVPDRTKYGINAADPGSVAKAKSQGNKILNGPGK